MNHHQTKQILPITRHPAYRRSIERINELLAQADERRSSLSFEEKIDHLRWVVFGCLPEDEQNQPETRS